MDRMIQRNVIAMSGRAVEASGDVDVLLLDKTGTITLGNRAATQFFFRHQGLKKRISRTPRQLSSLADETPEGRSIVVLAKERYKLRGRDLFLAQHDLYSVFQLKPECPVWTLTAAKFAKALWKQSAA